MSYLQQLYKEPKSELWTGRIDSLEDEAQFRVHQVVKTASLNSFSQQNKKVVLGFVCDIGVKRNGGRAGAALGANYLRSSIGSMCWHGSEEGFFDVGNIKPEQTKLEEGQEALGEAIYSLLQTSNTPIVIGGGHETAFGHYLGISKHLQNHHKGAKLGILNIDAHFDLRPYGVRTHSGSPFLQALDHAKAQDMPLEYFVYGINRDNNTDALFKTAQDYKVGHVTNREIKHSLKDSLEPIKQFIQEQDFIYLTICLDVFDASIAPGVSAPAWDGISLLPALEVIDLVKNSGKLLSADICELNPLFDEQLRTVRTAGTLFGELIR
jgi:formiminoglutamase